MVNAPASSETRSLDQWLQYITATHPAEIEMGLERVRTVAERLDVLEPAPRSVIVAGTNGKGTTSVLLEQLLLGAGLRVGCSLSPHVHRFNERVRIDGNDVDDAGLCSAFEAVEAARGATPLTYFEFAALVALHAFREAAVDVAVLEIGLGGRLDAFNIVDADVGVITSIGLDHTEYLGDDVESIGAEKAGILRDGQRVVLGSEMPASVLDRADDAGGQILELGRNLHVTRRGATWTAGVADQTYDDLPVGQFPLGNCALAIGAARCLTDLDRSSIARAVAGAWLPGRLETFDVWQRAWLVDVAHNPLGAEFLGRELDERGHDGVIAVFGALRDKDVAAMRDALRDKVRDWVLVDAPSDRGQPVAELTDCFQDLKATAATSLTEGLEVARSLSNPRDVILVFGSFGIAEQARRRLQSVADQAMGRSTEQSMDPSIGSTDE